MSALYRDFTTAAEIDAEYDVEKAVPDFTIYARQYVGGSRAARARLRGFHKLRFGPSRDEYVDVFPAAEPNAPVLIFFHGGYWRILAAEDFSFVAEGPVAAGVTVVVANYSLCPKVTIDEITRQARATVAWTHRRIREHGGDPGRIYVSGHSAGGQLTAMCLLTDWERDYGLPRDVVKGGIAISGVFDLTPIKHTSMQPQIRLTDEEIQRNSPQFHIRPAPAPLLVTYGGDETAEFCRQSEDFLSAWLAAGNHGSGLAQPGANHFTAITGFAMPDSGLCRAVFELMRHRPRRTAHEPSAARDIARMRGRPGDVSRFDRDFGRVRPVR
jgi:arylformamidase